MASLHPFRALRPTPERAADVSSVPYDVVSTEEARQLAADNPLSFLRVTRSEIDLPAGVGSLLVRGLRAGPEQLRRASAPGAARSRRRAVAVFVPPADGDARADRDRRMLLRGRVRERRHQEARATRRDKEDDRTRHIVELRAQTGVVFLTYKADRGIDSIERRVTSETPLFDFTAADGVRHTIWRAGDEDVRALEQAFAHYPRALHRGWSSSRRQRRESACRIERPRRRVGSRYLHRRGVPRQPDAGAPVQPDRQGSCRA